MNPRRSPQLAAVLFTSGISNGMLSAQTPGAVVNGTVVDPTGAAIPDTKVRVVGILQSLPRSPIQVCRRFRFLTNFHAASQRW
jgi:hypothetical protein